MILSVIQLHLQQIKNNRIISLAILLTTFFILFIGHYNGHFIQSIVYLLSIWLCSFFIDLYILLKPEKSDFIVRKPKRETIYLLICTFLGYLFLFIRFSGNWQNMSGFLKLLSLPLMLFAFPIALAVIMLLLKYKPKELGFRLQGIFAVLPIILILAIATFLVAPENIKWKEMISEEGIIGLLITGFISSALSEEFWRIIAQTRLAALFRNTGSGWFLATFIWAFMHAPKWYSESNNIIDTLFSSIRIIPIGLMWGYLTYKTKSILPSIIIHGTNLWGLQNF